jgi:hypothetical protein
MPIANKVVLHILLIDLISFEGYLIENIQQN